MLAFVLAICITPFLGRRKNEREKGSRRPLVYLDSTSKVGGKMVACCILEKLYCLS